MPISDRRCDRLFGIACLVLTVGTACTERSYEVEIVNGADGAAGGGNGDGGRSDAKPSVDVRPFIDSSIKQDANTGPCIKTGQPETCNGLDDDCNGMTDDVDPTTLETTEACGKCGVVCSSPTSARAVCASKACAYECEPDFVDIDKSKVNGCECRLVGAEHDATKTKNETACDDRDNDCDGQTDEGFDKMVDVNNCGACNYRCLFPFAMSSCEAGMCKMLACLPGYIDRDKNPANGCEYPCEKTNGGAEICDGRDNDCNGMVDENVTPTIACNAKGVCAGTVPTCMGAKGWQCNYSTIATWEANEQKAKGCDGLDNDCDGVADDAFGVGVTCTVGTGACRRTGKQVCNAAKTDVECNMAAGTAGNEVCNGQDDDCDGKTDELDPADRTSDERFVYLTGPGVTMFAYEAARYDATDSAAGADSSRRPCASPGRVPWANVTKEAAESACRLVGTGWRLCTKTEWEGACKGSGGKLFPYGDAYVGTMCNGADFVRTPPTATTIGGGTAAMCISSQAAGATDDILDMSGNVKEWVISGATNADPKLQTYELRGGAYNVASFVVQDPAFPNDPTKTIRIAPGLQCDASTPAPPGDVRLPSVGFRCCKPGMF